MPQVKKKQNQQAGIFVDQKRVAKVSQSMKPDNTIDKLARTFKVLGDPTRSKIVFALSRQELCVSDIANLLGLSQSAVSHQLRVLRNLDLVRHRRENRMTYYLLSDEHIRNLFTEGLKHVEEKL